MKKTCIHCHIEKPIDEFHRHARMRDGRLNKCARCVVASVKAWRLKNPNAREGEYQRAIESGRVVLKGGRSASGPDIEARRRRSSKYMHKRNSRTVVMTELDAFVMDEALRLRQMREKATDIKWSIDHRIPLNHKDVCGLHVGINFQVVPASWNYRKCNKNMADFWPLGY